MVNHDVAEHFPMVQRMAHSLARRLPSSVRVDDLISAGSLGLVEAGRRYDPEQGVPFHSYAALRVRGAMLDSLRSEATTTRGARRHEREVSRCRDTLRARLGRAPEDEEIAETLGIDAAAVAPAVIPRQVSLDDLGVDDEHAGPIQVALTCPEASAFDRLAAEDVRGEVAAALETLTERQRLVLSLYYVEELRLREIGDILGVTESRICQIHGQALRALEARLATD